MESIRSLEVASESSSDVLRAEKVQQVEESREHVITQLRLEVSDLRSELDGLQSEIGGLLIDEGKEFYAERTLNFFSLDNPFRIVCLMVVKNPYFEFLMMLLILLNIATIAAKNPAEYALEFQDLSAMGQFIFYCEIIFLVAYTTEAVVKMVAFGLFLGARNTYFRSAWNVFDFLVVLSGWLMYVNDLGAISTVLRIVRIFRILSGIKRAKKMRVVLECVIQSLPALLSLGGVIFLFLMLFGVVGVQLFGGTLVGRCFNETTSEFVDVDTVCSLGENKLHSLVDGSVPLPDLFKGWIRGIGGKQCATGTVCMYYGNPRGGWVNFDNIGYSVLTIFQVCTLVGWVDDMYFVQDGFSPYAWIYFVLLVVLGGIVLQNIFTAVIVSSYEDIVTQQKRQALRNKFFYGDDGNEIESDLAKSSDESTDGDDDEELETAEAEYLRKLVDKVATDGATEHIVRVLFRFYRNVPRPKYSSVEFAPNGWRYYVQHVVYDRVFDFIFTISILINTCVLCMRWFDMNVILYLFVVWIDRIIVALWVIEFAVKYISVFPGNAVSFFRCRANFLDMLVLLLISGEICWSVLILLVDVDLEALELGRLAVEFTPMAMINAFGDVITTMSVFRIFRLLLIRRRPGRGIIEEEEDTSLIKRKVYSSKLVDALGEVPKMALLIGIFWVVYALVGMRLFARNMPGVPWNFDTLFRASVTSFQLLTTENWPFVMYDALQNTDSEFYSLIFFVSAIVISNWILLNLFIAVIVGVFSTRAEKTTMRRIERLAMFVTSAFMDHHLDSSHLEDIPALNRAMEICTNSRNPALLSHTEDTPGSFPSVEWFRSHRRNPMLVLPRFYMRHILESKIYTILSLLPVVLSVLILGIAQHGSSTVIELILLVVEVLFFILAVVEFLLRTFFFGLIFTRHAQLHNIFNVFDAICMVASAVSLILQLVLGYSWVVAVLRCIRFFRILRLHTFRRMRVILKAVFISVRESLFFAALIVFIFVVFAVFGVGNYGGTLHGCNDDIAPFNESKAQCIGTYYNGSTPYYSHVVIPREWGNVNDFSFDNLLDAFVSLFTVMNFAGWLDILYAIMDSTGEYSAFLFFSLFIIATSILGLNLFVAVLIENVLLTKEDEEGITLLGKMQREWHYNKLYIKRMQPVALPRMPSNAFLHTFCYIVNLSVFNHISFVVALLILIVFASQFIGMPEGWQLVLDIACVIFIFVLAIDLLLRATADVLMRTPRVFFSFWNIYTTIVVLVATIALTAAGLSIVPMLVVRAVVVFASLRVIQRVESLQLMATTIYESLPELFQLMDLMFIFFFLYSVVGVAMFGDVAYNEYITPRVNFKNILIGILTLLRIATVDAWIYVQYGLMYMDPFHCNPEQGNCGNVYAPLFFSTFIIITNYIFFSLIIAVFVEKLSQVGERKNCVVRPDHVLVFQELWSEHDPRATGYIDFLSLRSIILALPKPLGLQGKGSAELLTLAKKMDIKPVSSGSKSKHEHLYAHKEVLRALVSCSLRVKRRKTNFSTKEMASVHVLYARPVYPILERVYSVFKQNLHSLISLLGSKVGFTLEGEDGTASSVFSSQFSPRSEQNELIAMDIFTAEASKEFLHPSFYEEVAANIIQESYRSKFSEAKQ